MPPTATDARNQLSPLLGHLCQSLRAAGKTTRSAVFERLRRQLDRADDSTDVSASLLRLTSFCALRQERDPTEETDALIELLLRRVERLQSQINQRSPTIH